MKDGFIKIASCSPLLRVADTKYNTEQILGNVADAYRSGANMVCFPELCITGCTCGDLFNFDVLLSGALNSLCEIKAKTADMDIISVVGLPLCIDGQLYNAVAVMYKGKVLGISLKSSISERSELCEDRYFSSGRDITSDHIVIDSETIPVGCNLIYKCSGMENFCFGIEFSEELCSASPLSFELCKNGAVIIINPSASSEIVGRDSYRKNLVLSKSAQLICGYVYTDAGQGESTTDMVFSGHGMIAEKGRLLAERKPFDDNMIISEIDVDRLSFERRKMKSFEQSSSARVITFDMPIRNCALTRSISSHPFIPDSDSEISERCEHILNIQAHGLKKRLEHSRAAKAVIGISGGLDSCLSLLVCANTMKLLSRPMTDVIAVTMPCFGTTKRTKTNAQLLCEGLGVTFKEVDITESVKAHLKDIGHDGSPDVAYENAQARERTQVLMDIANMENGLVIGTGDLSEVALGWSTYNGDHMSMYGVNASIPKTLIRYIVKYVADCNNDIKAVLYDILDTPVSPELLPDKDGEIAQKTEDIVGPYELHDFFIYYFVSRGFSPKKIFRLAQYAFNGKYNDETILKWLTSFFRRFFTQQFKRSCTPDAPKVGSVSLSPRGDWKMPSDAVCALWLDELDKLKQER